MIYEYMRSRINVLYIYTRTRIYVCICIHPARSFIALVIKHTSIYQIYIKKTGGIYKKMELSK